MQDDIHKSCWPKSRLPEAIEALARRSGLAPRRAKNIALPDHVTRPSGERLDKWIDVVSECLGIEAQPVETPLSEIERFVRTSAPAIIQIDAAGDETLFLALIKRGRDTAVLTPELETKRLKPQIVCETIRSGLEAPFRSDLAELLDDAGLRSRAREKAIKAILEERLRSARIGGLWILRSQAGSSIWRQSREAQLPRRLLTLLGAHTIEYLLLILAWWMIGRGILAGRLDYGWLWAWILLLVTMIPFRLMTTWSQGMLAIGAGVILKRRLLLGALRLEPEEVRHQGAGQLLGRVVESEAVESLALSAGLLGLIAVVELLFAATILYVALDSFVPIILFVCWTVVTSLLVYRYYRQRQQWTAARLEITNDLVERMTGHRTRLAQQSPEHWHDGEDEAIDRYIRSCLAMDRSGARLIAILPRGWLILGLVSLVPLFTSAGSSSAALAVGFGSILLAFGALKTLAEGLSHLAGLAIAWQQVSPLYHAAAREETVGAPDFVVQHENQPVDAREKQMVLEALDLTFRHQDRSDLVLQHCSLHISDGDRVLVQGVSGSGKSTLASVLVGLRHPQSGMLSFRGLDRQTLGSHAWRRCVAAAPQFHENYVLAGSLGFNLLMGRRWPPEPEDYQEAEAVCRELGLGHLLERMPAGLAQIVGETGWQLSHGERSRLFIARALLQNADVIILDESFGALDPQTVNQAVHCVLKRANALMVIAHP